MALMVATKKKIMRATIKRDELLNIWREKKKRKKKKKEKKRKEIHQK